MSRFGFCGGTYTSLAVNSDAQRCINLYPEQNESGMGNSAMSLYSTPGLKLFSGKSGAQVRGEFTITNRSFAVTDSVLEEILSNGTRTAIGVMVNDGQLASMVASPQQLLVESGGMLYVYYLRTVGSVPAGTFFVVPPATFSGPVSEVAYSDGFFLALIASTEQYYQSQLFDATVWPAQNVTTINTFPDNVVSFIVDHREVWLFGAKQSEVDYDAGTSPFAFAPVPGGYLEQGCAARDATVQLDNGIFWIGQRNDQGGHIAWRTNGYSPQRISTFAIESAWNSYSTVADARAFSYVMEGHSFWVINFPTANATWCYDVATSLWHERGFWLAQAGIYQAALPQVHTYNFDKHLVGDRQSGNIYQMQLPMPATGGGWDFVTDDGALIRRMRRAPHVSTEHQRIFFSQLEVYMESGLGPQPPLRDGAGQPRDPIMTMRYSKDGGHTWSSGQDRGVGQAGQYRKRVLWRRLGVSRDRVFEVSMSDPIPWRLVDAYLLAEPGFTPKRRVVHEYGEVA